MLHVELQEQGRVNKNGNGNHHDYDYYHDHRVKVTAMIIAIEAEQDRTAMEWNGTDSMHVTHVDEDTQYDTTIHLRRCSLSLEGMNPAILRDST